MLGVADDCHAVHRWRDIPEQLQALAAELHRHERYAGHVAAWPRETVDEARRDRIGAHAEHDGDRQGEFVHLECGRPLRYDKVDGKSHQLRRERGHTLDLVVAEAELDREVTALDIAQLGKSGAQRLEVGCPYRFSLALLPACGPMDAAKPKSGTTTCGEICELLMISSFRPRIPIEGAAW